jgi:hypothetical protein
MSPTWATRTLRVDAEEPACDVEDLGAGGARTASSGCYEHRPSIILASWSLVHKGGRVELAVGQVAAPPDPRHLRSTHSHSLGGLPALASSSAQVGPPECPFRVNAALRGSSRPSYDDRRLSHLKEPPTEEVHVGAACHDALLRRTSTTGTHLHQGAVYSGATVEVWRGEAQRSVYAESQPARAAPSSDRRTSRRDRQTS